MGSEERSFQLEVNNRSTALTNIEQMFAADNFVYKHPDILSERSNVACIGLWWTMPPVVCSKPLTTELIKKPTWSWLVTQGTIPITQKHKTKNEHVASTSLHLPAINNSTQKVKKYARDVHPISTAMNRDGTSISRTRWKVPISSTSILDTERSLLRRLELVKRGVF
uniref:Uncharacterized protein n=1 Tax=Arion vulgaris TaxID=1028688 RepID=A0A0B6Y9X6_9EUPU